MAKSIRPEELRLSNGIPVILQHCAGPVAATYWWIQTGSADEAPEETGFAHFLEHMLFKDAAARETGKASTGQMATAIESLGGDINAYTSFDQTVYHVTCAAHHWERVLGTFGTMANQKRFSPADFAREREVILEELRKNEDSPGRQLFQKLFSATFAKHPYGRPVIGFEKILRGAKVGQVERFFKRNYVSGKMGLILVGPLEDGKGKRKADLMKLLEKRYGSQVFRSTPATFRPRPIEPELRKKIDWRVTPFDVQTPSLSLSFRVPDLSHPDIPALDLLANIIGMGELSRLYQSLFYKSSLVTDVSAGLFVPKDAGMLYFQAEMDSLDKMEAITRGILEEVKRIETDGPTPEELARVLVNAESERLYSTQTADGMAGRIGFLKFIMGDLNFDQIYLEDLRAVDAFKIKEVAQKYFTPDRMAGVLLVPKKEVAQAHAQVKVLDELVRKELTRPPSLPKVKSVKGQRTVASEPIEYFERPSGLRACFYPRPHSHVMSIHAATLGGLRLEIANPIEKAETDWGASYFLASTWAKGTSQRTAREILALTEGHASSIDGFSGRNSIGLQLTGLARDYKLLSGLFREVLCDPLFPESEVEHVRRVAEDSIRGVEDHSSQLCSKLFLETLFQEHPYGRMTHGSLESIPHLHSQKLQAFHQAWVRPERLVISASGALRRADFEKFLSELEEQLQKAAENWKSGPVFKEIRSEPPLKSPRWIERSLGREQSHILIGGLGTQVDASDRHVLRLLQTLLGGQSGRLFIELREKKSLAYTVAPVSFEGVERGYVGTYIASAPDKREQAVSGIQKVLETLAEKGPTAKEMTRSKEFFLGRRAMDLQGDTSIASHYGLESLYRIPYVSELELIQKIKAVSPKEIQNACRKYMVEPFQVTSTVG